MHYVKQFNINGVDTRQVACIESKGRPNAATEGCVGALCIDVTSPLHDVYKCVAVEGNIYTWELLSSGLSIVSSSVSGKGADEVQFNYSDLRTPLTYLLKAGDLILDSEGYLYQVSSINTTYCVATYLGVNLVASTHTHPAEDIDSGILPYERGGTNTNSFENLKSNLGISFIEEILKALDMWGTPGLAYVLVDDTYQCSGIGTATEHTICILPKIDGIRVTSIGLSAFSGRTSITSVVIPTSVISIGKWAFQNCTSLVTVEIGESVTTMGQQPFIGCASIRHLFIPRNVTDMGLVTSYNFIGNNSWCARMSSLESIEVDVQNTTYKSIDGNVYTNDEKTLLIYSIGKQNSSFTIPNSVTHLYLGALEGCVNLKEIIIPDSVTNIGACAFKGCTSLENITIPASVEWVDSRAFENCSNLKTVVFKGRPSMATSSLDDILGGNQFSSCTSLTDIYVPWSSGVNNGAPWGAPNATVHYNSEV